MFVGLLIGIFINAVLIGAIIAWMEGDFPEWLNLMGCVIVISLATSLTSAALPGLWSLLGIVVGALVGAVVISALCGMEIKRAAIAASIYLGVKLSLSVAFLLLMSQ